MDSHGKALDSTARMVLESWAMMLIDECESVNSAFSSNEDFVCSTVEFKGPVNGALTILAQKSFLTTLAGNLLGEDITEATGAAEIQDAFREMANVVTGNFLTEAFGEQPVFDVVMPKVFSLNWQDGSQQLHNKNVCVLSADGCPVALSCEIQGTL